MLFKPAKSLEIKLGDSGIEKPKSGFGAIGRFGLGGVTALG